MSMTKARICGWLTDYPIWEVTDDDAMYTVTLNQYDCFRPRVRGASDQYRLDPKREFQLIDMIDACINEEKKRMAGTMQDRLNRTRLLKKLKEDRAIDKAIMSINGLSRG